MNNRVLYGIIAVIAILIIAGVVYSQSKEANSPESTNQTSNVDSTKDASDRTEQASPSTNTSTETQGTLSDETAMEDTEAAIHEISFNGTAFTPNTLTIKNGDIVVFKNNSDKNFWPASAPHPQHTNYPEFDADQPLASGKTFSFKFTKVGKWGFHDHLTPTAFGSITVE